MGARYRRRLWQHFNASLICRTSGGGGGVEKKKLCNEKNATLFGAYSDVAYYFYSFSPSDDVVLFREVKTCSRIIHIRSFSVLDAYNVYVFSRGLPSQDVLTISCSYFQKEREISWEFPVVVIQGHGNAEYGRHKRAMANDGIYKIYLLYLSSIIGILDKYLSISFFL